MTTRASRRALTRGTVVLAVAAATMTGGLLMAGTAQAQTVDSGSLSVTSDPGDYIGGGQSYSYSTDAGDTLSVSGSTDDRTISVSVSGANGDWWDLDLQAPSGQTLSAGDYTDATRYPFNSATAPGLSFDGNGRGCNELTGSFTISDVVFGPQGYVQELDGGFEQHCEGATAASYGQIHITNPAPPPTLTLTATVDADGTASTLNGKAGLSGTVTCDEPVTVNVGGTVTEDAEKVLINGSFATSVDCVPGAPVAWTASATPDATTPFQKGKVEVDSTVSAADPNYGQNVSVSQTSVVHLAKLRP